MLLQEYLTLLFERPRFLGNSRMIHQMVRWLGLDRAINQSVNLFKLYLPYSESDHVLNIAYNLLAGGPGTFGTASQR